ncbi:MAG: hypothetical protein U0736_08915 [Gemmataceae bacterium]
MTEYQIQASTRRCAATGRELQPGEACYSVLLDEGGAFVRRDYSVEAWQGPPAGTFSFWKMRLPTGGSPKRPPMDDELVLECFHRLEGELEPRKRSFRFVLALLLVRRRRLRLEDTCQEDGQEVLTLRCTRTGTRCRVVDPGLADDEIEAVQDEVFQVLGW